MMRVALVVLAAAGLAACNPVQKSAQLVATAAPGQLLSAGPGDTVMDVKLTKSLPNAFGGADVFGRTTDAGRVNVQYVGSQGKTANLIRQNILIETNETTMTRTPLIIPTTQTTMVNGMVGTTPVSGTATTQNLAVIGPRTPQGYSSASPAIPISVQEGRSVAPEGRTLTVLRVLPNGIDHSQLKPEGPGPARAALVPAIYAALARGEIEAEAEDAAQLDQLPRSRERPIPTHAKSASVAPRLPLRRPLDLERRRRWAASGWLPPQLAQRFTPGEAAVLAVAPPATPEPVHCRGAGPGLHGCPSGTVRPSPGTWGGHSGPLGAFPGVPALAPPRGAGRPRCYCAGAFWTTGDLADRTGPLIPQRSRSQLRPRSRCAGTLNYKCLGLSR